MAKKPDSPKKSGKTPKSKAPNPRRIGPTCSRSGRRWRNCSIPRSTAAMPAWDRAPACSRRRTIPGIAAPAAKPPRIARGRRPRTRGARCDGRVAQPSRGKSAASRSRSPGGGTAGLDEAPQANYGTSATIPTLDPELAKQLGFTTEEEDVAALARPPRNKMEALGVAATADALEALIRDGRPEFKGEDGQRENLDAAPPAAPGEIRRRRALRASSPNTSRRATSRPRSPNWSRASTATTARRCCSASPAPARPTPWPR